MTSQSYQTDKLLTTDDWFNDIIARLRVDQTKIKNKTATKDLKNFYNMLLAGTPNEFAHLNKKIAHQHFVPLIVTHYLQAIQNNMPEQLAFAYTDSEVLVWAEVKDDDYETEKKLILAAAKVNAKFHRFGYDITNVFVEESDKLEIPNHYQPFKEKKYK